MIEKIGPTVYNGGTIYNIGAGGGGGDLPEGYTPALYAKANGNVSLTFTGLNLNLNDRYFLKCCVDLVENNNGSNAFCIYAGSWKLYPYLAVYSDLSVVPSCYYGNNASITGDTFSYNNSYLIKISSHKRYCYFDVDAINYHKRADRGTDFPDTPASTLQLFNYQGRIAKGIVYSLKVYDKDNPDKLNADFVPCRNENNVLGFYEKISGQFQGDANLIT